MKPSNFGLLLIGISVASIGVGCSSSSVGPPSDGDAAHVGDVGTGHDAAIGNDAAPTTCTAVQPHAYPITDPYTTTATEFELVLSSGNTIYGYVTRPDASLYPDQCFPTVVMVPGGINPGMKDGKGPNATMLAEAGMVVLNFNAEGRGSDTAGEKLSEGQQGFNGHQDQDALKDVFNYALGLEGVLKTNVGISSFSYGITMAAGFVGRYPDLPIKYLVDGEGPHNSYTTCHEPRFRHGDYKKYKTVEAIFGRKSTHQDQSAENLAWWAEREADKFIGNFKGKYLRIQAEWDHAQPPESQDQVAEYAQYETADPPWWQNKHTSDMVNAAIAGGVPWVRVNLEEQGNTLNATYDLNNRPTFVPGGSAKEDAYARGILEMARMP